MNTLKQATINLSGFKSCQLRSEKVKTKFSWEYNQLPAMFDIKLNYKIFFNIENIKKEFIKNNKLNYFDFFHDIIKPNFSEYALLKTSRTIFVPGFNVVYVTYNSEFDIKTLNPIKNDRFYFSHAITLEASDTKKCYRKCDIINISQEMMTKLENSNKSIFTNSKFFRIAP
jgi:hypothetical protein